MPTLVGKTVGKYKLLELLGRGGMAEVYKARHPTLDRDVTVKVLHRHLADGEGFLARFEREAKAVAAMRHPRIVQIFDYEAAEDANYMVMEFVDGGTLQDRVVGLAKQGKSLPVREALSILNQVAEALDYAHGRGILHRDVKPSNILLDSSGNAYLTDFGIARILSSSQFTVTGVMVGTPAYMSPEQGSGEELTAASDIYSLGIIVYELLAGKVPFLSETTPLAIIHKHINEPPPNLHARRPDLPAAAEKAVLKALAKKPEDRFRTAGDFIRELEKTLPKDAIAKLDRSGAQSAVPIGRESTQIMEDQPVPGRAQMPTEVMEAPVRMEPAPPPAAVAESTPPPGPAVEKSTHTIRAVLLAGLGFLGSRILLEELARLTNYFGLGVDLAGLEILLGAFGLCVGALLWLTLRSLGVHLGRTRGMALLAIWGGSSLLVGLFAFSLAPTNGDVWNLGYALSGLLGGLFTGLILAGTVPHFQIKHVLLLSGASAISFYLENFIAGHSIQFWSTVAGGGFGNSISYAAASGLAGILIGGTLLLLVRSKEGLSSLRAPSGTLDKEKASVSPAQAEGRKGNPAVFAFLGRLKPRRMLWIGGGVILLAAVAMIVLLAMLSGPACNGIEGCLSAANEANARGDKQAYADFLLSAIDQVPGDKHPLYAGLWCDRGDALLALGDLDLARGSFLNCFNWTNSLPDMQGMRDRAMAGASGIRP
jgi:serine/threonine protein kinase